MKRRRRRRRRAGDDCESESDADGEEDQKHRALCRAVHVTEDNHVHFRADCSAESMLRLEECVREALKGVHCGASERPALHLHVESYGGDASATLRVYDWLRALRGVRLVTWIEGYVASAGTVLAMAADERRMMPNALMMVHEVLSGDHASMRFTEAQDDVAHIRMLTERLVQIYAGRTGIRTETVRELLRRDLPIDQAAAIATGLATHAEPGPTDAETDDGRTQAVADMLRL